MSKHGACTFSGRPSFCETSGYLDLFGGLFWRHSKMFKSFQLVVVFNIWPIWNISNTSKGMAQIFSRRPTFYRNIRKILWDWKDFKDQEALKGDILKGDIWKWDFALKFALENGIPLCNSHPTRQFSLLLPPSRRQRALKNAILRCLGLRCMGLGLPQQI